MIKKYHKEISETLASSSAQYDIIYALQTHDVEGHHIHIMTAMRQLVINEFLLCSYGMTSVVPTKTRRVASDISRRSKKKVKTPNPKRPPRASSSIAATDVGTDYLKP